MKKWKILIPSLTATISMPVFSLCGCVNNNTADNIKIVQFDSKYGSYVPSVKVEAGQPIPRPANPTREGKVFQTWYVEGTTKSWNWAQPVENDMTLYAQWRDAPAPAPEDVILNYSDITLNIGATQELSACVLPKQAVQTVTWESENNSIATVNKDGVVEAKAGGKVNILVYPVGHKTTQLIRKCAVTVIESDEPALINISKTSLSLEKGATDQLFAQVLPQKASQRMTWESKDQSVVEITHQEESGVTIKAVAKGQTTIIVKSLEDERVTNQCEVTVTETDIPTPESILINKQTLNLHTNGSGHYSETLFAYISPIEASQDVDWISDDPSVATVDPNNGTVTAAPGAVVGAETIISAWPKDCDHSTFTPATCSVTIVNDQPVVEWHEVTFFDDKTGGSEIESQTIKDGECAIEPPKPTKFGFDFVGWFDLSTDDSYDFDDPVSEDIDIYAKWIEKSGTSVEVNVLNPDDDGFSITEPDTPFGQEATLHVNSATYSIDENSVRIVIVDGQTIPKVGYSLEGEGEYATLTINGEWVKGDIQVGFNVNKDPHPNNFATDPWTTVCYYADKGIDALCEAYNCQPAQFVGQTRKIILNNQIHYVKVVGVDQDTYDDEENQTKKAALTFQFDTVISDDSGDGLQIQWDKTSSREEEEYNVHNYWGSTVDNALNSLQENVEWKGSSLRKSVYSMIEESNAAWINSIKAVNRSVNVFDGTSTDKVPFRQEEAQKKLFCPTLSNLFSDTGIADTDWTELISNEEKDVYKVEGQVDDQITKQYMYYADSSKIGNKTIDNDGDSFECLKITDTAQYGDETTYGYNFWTASPLLHKKLKSEEAYSWEIKSDLDPEKETDSVQHLWNGCISSELRVCVAPCFCI